MLSAVRRVGLNSRYFRGGGKCSRICKIKFPDLEHFKIPEICLKVYLFKSMQFLQAYIKMFIELVVMNRPEFERGFCLSYLLPP